MTQTPQLSRWLIHVSFDGFAGVRSCSCGYRWIRVFAEAFPQIGVAFASSGASSDKRRNCWERLEQRRLNLQLHSWIISKAGSMGDWIAIRMGGFFLV